MPRPMGTVPEVLGTEVLLLVLVSVLVLGRYSQLVHPWGGREMGAAAAAAAIG
jgi:hypothetical protein